MACSPSAYEFSCKLVSSYVCNFLAFVSIMEKRHVLLSKEIIPFHEIISFHMLRFFMYVFFISLSTGLFEGFPEFSQASVYSLLQATSEISSRGDLRDREINVFVQKRYLVDPCINFKCFYWRIHMI